MIIQLFGTPTPEHLAAAEKDLRDALSRLRSPVDVLSDIRELETLAAILAEDVNRLGQLLSLHGFGIRKLVRVVGKSAQAALQMERISRQINGNTAHLAFSMDEAEQVFSK